MSTREPTPRPRPRALSAPLRRYNTNDSNAGKSRSTRPLSIISERVPLPRVRPLSVAVQYTTPLPTLSIVVLSIALLSEFLTASVSTPFLLFMVAGFDEFKESKEDVGVYAGILVSSFFLGQFLTSLLWASIATRYSPRFVLTTALTGATLTVSLFGFSTSFRTALFVRFGQGLFAGSVGVARSCIGTVTDTSNQSRAYAIISFFWGIGGVIGSVLGGTLESPAQKYPAVFGSFPLFAHYPYVLPTSLAACITLLGALLSFLLAPDAGPRSRPTAPSLAVQPAAIARSARPTIKTHSRVSTHSQTHEHAPLVPSPLRTTAATLPATDDREPGGLAIPRRGRGGYGAVSFSDALSPISPSSYSTALGSPGSVVSRHVPHLSSMSPPRSSLARRVVIAHRQHVSGLADLWVASALSAELPFAEEDEDEDEDEGEEDVEEDEDAMAPRSDRGELLAPGPGAGGDADDELSPSRANAYGPRSPSWNDFRSPTEQFLRHRPRALSTVSNRARRRSVYDSVIAAQGIKEKDEDMPSLPWAIIAQYGMLALHGTTHDMIFMNFLVSKFELGGLGLTAGDFSQLTALMCIFQTMYQFLLYPFLSGRLPHLVIFRTGVCLILLAYVTSAPLQRFASPDVPEDNIFVWIGLIFSSVIRFCGSTLSYTAIAILINCVTPPSVLGLANGVGQSAVSLARCIGPILGGYVWSTSTDGNPAGYYVPFATVASMAFFALLSSFTI